MTQIDDKSWYLLMTKPRQEQTALVNLERQDYQAYLPCIEVSRHRQGRHRWVVEPMFPRYVFVRLSCEHDNWSPLRSTRGVLNMVRFGGMPARVPDTLIDTLHNNETEKNSQPENPTPQFEEGSLVRIVGGAFAGYDAIFAEQSGSKRASILLSIADKFTRITLPIDDIDAV